MSMEWFDTHAHLGDAKFDEDREAVIAEFLKGGVTRLVEIADGPEEWEKAQRLAEAHRGKIWFTAGIHPYFADQNSPEIWTRLRQVLSHPLCVGLGEVGLDFAKCQIPKEVQVKTFSTAVDLAFDMDKPLVIHCRDAFSEMGPLLQKLMKKSANRSSPPGVIHCFSGNKDDLQPYLDLGFFFGLDGPITYPSAGSLREAVDHLPLSRLVLETDSPYLPPQTKRGKRNHPALLPEVGAKLAELKKVPLTEAASATLRNGEILYRLK